MADAAPALRRTSPLAAHRSVSFGLMPPMTRLSARGGADALRKMCGALGLEPPPDFLRARVSGETAALSIGPDEVLLLAPENGSLANTVEAALEGQPGSVVDVSHRQLGIMVTGAGAAMVLNTGCPLDLSREAFPPGMCTRTILNKAEVVMWRQEHDRFHLECWRSFSPYVMEFLKLAANDAGF